MTATLTSWKYYIIEPELAVNLCTNPSFEGNVTTSFVSSGASIDVSTEQARRGKYSLKVSPIASTTDAVAAYEYAVSNGQAYSWSVDLYGTAGVTYAVNFATTADAALATATTQAGNGHWQRMAVSYTATADLTVWCKAYRVADASDTTAFYVDGCLLKTGSENTYFDGDSVDPYLDTPQFYWTGTPHASTSTRLASTRAGGTLLDISTYCKVRGINGLGMTGIVTNTSGLALGGEMYQNSHANARVFQLSCEAYIGPTSDYGTLQRKFARLEKAVNPKRMKVDQPLRMMVVGYDANGVEASDRVIIECAYEGGLEGTLTGRVLPFVMTFRQFDPVIKADGYNVTSLSASGTAVNCGPYGSLLLISEITGATTTVTGFDNIIRGITKDDNGGFYIWGDFTAINSTADFGIVYRNSSGTLASVTATGSTGAVYDAIFGTDGYLYIGTGATGIGGVANADYIAKTDGASFDPLSTGLNGACRALAIDGGGNLYAGGAFTTAGGLTVNRITKWTGATFEALGSGTVGFDGGVVLAIACLPDGTVVIGGTMTNGGGTAANDYLVTFDGTNYGLLGGTAPDNSVSRLLYDKSSGILYAFGTFTTIGGISANGAAYWDGNNWNPMTGSATTNYATLHENGNVYAYFNALTIGGIGYTAKTAYWNGSNWVLAEFDNDRDIYNVYYRSLTQDFVICSLGALGADAIFTIPAVSTITNSTEGDIYPSVTLDATGYYVYSLYNRTTGERIFLNGLRVYTGEKIELVFSSTGYTIISDVRGDMRSSVLSGSSPTFHLQPGANYVSIFVYPSPVTNVTVPLKYPAAGYISLNETVYE